MFAKDFQWIMLTKVWRADWRSVIQVLPFSQSELGAISQAPDPI